MEESRDIDADSDGSEEDSSDEDRCVGLGYSTCVYILTKLSDDEDEAAELMRELEKIKKERLEQKEKEVCSLKLLHDSG